MEVLLVRFEKKERAFIKKWARKSKVSEAAIVRSAVNNLIATFAERDEKLKDAKQSPQQMK